MSSVVTESTALDTCDTPAIKKHKAWNLNSSEAHDRGVKRKQVETAMPQGGSASMEQKSPEVDKKSKQNDAAVTPAGAEHIIAMKKADLDDPSQDDVELVAIAHPEMNRDARQSSLQNRERTCWMNSLLRAMSAIPLSLIHI